MSEEFETTEKPRSHRLSIVIGAAAIALILATTGTIIFAQLNAPASQQGALAPAPSAQRDIPLSAGSPEGAGILSDSSAKSLLATIANVKTTDVEGPDALAKRLSKVIAGSYLKELQAQQQELEAYGWKITGNADVVSVAVGKTVTRKKQTIVKVRACIDNAGTQTLDSAGAVVPKAPGSGRAMHIFELAQNADGTWTAIRHTFPNDPKC